MNESSAEAMLLGRTLGSVGRSEEAIAGAERLLENSGLGEGDGEAEGEEDEEGIEKSTIRKKGRHEAWMEFPTRNHGSECRMLVAVGCWGQLRNAKTWSCVA